MTQAGERYTIRKKVFKFFGAAFHVYDNRGNVIGYCKQRAFKLKEDLRIFTGEDCTTEFLRMKARNVIDFGATYDILMPDGTALGSVRRKGLASTFVRDHWLIFNPEGTQIGEINEDNAGLAVARRFIPLVSLLSPQKFDVVKLNDPRPIATLRTHMNIFIRRISISIHQEDSDLDDLMILGIGCLLAAFEQRDER